jgi:hypothetical protein
MLCRQRSQSKISHIAICIFSHLVVNSFIRDLSLLLKLPFSYPSLPGSCRSLIDEILDGAVMHTVDIVLAVDIFGQGHLAAYWVQAISRCTFVTTETIFSSM